jgi:hypothetical protein
VSKNFKKEAQGHGSRCSEAALQVAKWAAQGNKRAWRLAREWAPSRQLMHPVTWSDWAKSADADFEQALGIAVLEMPELRESQVQGLSVVEYFSKQPAKLVALSKAGLDLNAPASGRLAVATLASRLDTLGLLGLAAAGAHAPKGRVGAHGVKDLSPPANALQVFLDAWGAMPAFVRPPSMDAQTLRTLRERREAARWLATGSDASARDSEGRDAFKRAIALGFEEGASLALELGASALSVDAKGRDALAFARAWIAGQEKKGANTERVKALLPFVISAMEKASMERSASLAPLEASGAPRKARAL